LAVLSCALALLTAQPWIARADDSARPAAVRNEAAAALATPASHQTPAQPLQSPAPTIASRRQIERAEAQARFQATWAVLQQWLITQLTAHTQVRYDLGDSLDLAIQIPARFAASVQVAGVITVSPRTWPLSPEQQFAIEHLLLSPPC
jgi:hypothetical protein